GVELEGDWTRVAILKLRDPFPWPHLKVVTVDGSAAYVGSANLTGPGLVGRNLELGVLVRGPQVRSIERTLDVIPVAAYQVPEAEDGEPATSEVGEEIRSEEP